MNGVLVLLLVGKRCRWGHHITYFIMSFRLPFPPTIESVKTYFKSARDIVLYTLQLTSWIALDSKKSVLHPCFSYVPYILACLSLFLRSRAMRSLISTGNLSGWKFSKMKDLVTGFPHVNTEIIQLLSLKKNLDFRWFCFFCMIRWTPAKCAFGCLYKLLLLMLRSSRRAATL